MFGKSCTAGSRPEDVQPEAAEGPAAPTYASDKLFGGRKEIRIVHQGFSYRLRITRTGGLILNK